MRIFNIYLSIFLSQKYPQLELEVKVANCTGKFANSVM